MVARLKLYAAGSVCLVLLSVAAIQAASVSPFSAGETSSQSEQEAAEAEEVTSAEDTEEVGGSATCGTATFTEYVLPHNHDGLAWVSEQVVIGTVTEELPPAWGEPITGGVDDDSDDAPLRTTRSIYTDYVIDVEYRLRGQDHDVIRTRIEGGTIGDCTITTDTTNLAVGDYVLLFLRGQGADNAHKSGPAYHLINPTFGVWDFVDGQSVVPRRALESADPDSTRDSRALEEVTYSWTDLRDKLLATFDTGEVPEGLSTGVSEIPLEQAPVQDHYLDDEQSGK